MAVRPELNRALDELGEAFDKFTRRLSRTLSQRPIAVDQPSDMPLPTTSWSRKVRRILGTFWKRLKALVN